MKLGVLNAARRFVEQQEELPICEPERERFRQLEQQHRVSGRVRCGGEHSWSVRAGEWEFVGSTEEESRLVPAMLETASENKTELGNLVDVISKRCPTHLFLGFF